MIKHFGVYPAAPAPGRGNDHRYTIPQPDRAFAFKFFGKVISLQLLFTGYKLDTDIYPLRNFTGSGFMRMRGHEWRDMIKIAVVFVVGEYKNGFFPDFGVVGKNVHHLRNIPRPVPGRARVIRKIFGRCYPRYGWQGAGVHILPELMEHIAP